MEGLERSSGVSFFASKRYELHLRNTSGEALLAGALAVAFFTFSPYLEDSFTFPKLHFTLIFVFSAVITIVIYHLLKYRTIQLKARLFDTAVAFPVIAHALSTFKNGLTFRGATDTLFLVASVTLFYLLAGLRFKKKAASRGFLLIAAVSLPLYIYALFQAAGIDPVFQAPEEMGRGRIFSFTGNKNYLGEISAVTLITGLALYVVSSGPAGSIFALFSVLLSGTVLFLVQSRAAFAGAAAGLLFFFTVTGLSGGSENKIFKKILQGFFISACLILILILPYNKIYKYRLQVSELLSRTFVPEKAENLRERLLMWRVALELAKKSPLFGNGPSSYQKEYLTVQAKLMAEDWRNIPFSGLTHHAHNEYLQILAEYGIFGFAAFIYALAVIFQAILKTAGRGGPVEMVEAGATGGALVAVLLVAFFAFPFHLPSTSTLLVALLAPFRNASKKAGRKISLSYPLQYLTLFYILFLCITVIISEKRIIEANFFLKGGKSFLQAGELVRAGYFLKKALSINPLDSRTFAELGTLCIENGEYEKAIACLLQALKDGEEPRITNDLAIASLRAGMVELARKFAGRTLELAPDKPGGHLTLGILHYLDGKTEEARLHFQVAVSGTSEIKPALMMAKFLAECGNPGPAVTLLEGFAGKEPFFTSRNAYIFARIFELAGYFSKAERYYRMALSIDFNTDKSRIYNEFSLFLIERGRKAEAEKMLQEGYRKTGSPLLLFNICRLLYETGRIEEAKASLHYLLFLLNGFEDEGKAMVNEAKKLLSIIETKESKVLNME